MDLVVQLNRISPVPLYHQLAARLKDAVANGELPKGVFLDNELDLAEQWQVSRPTVRRAIQELVDDGLLVRRRGVGTQVVNDQVRRPFSLSSLYDDLLAAGRSPTTEVIGLDTLAAPEDVALALGLSADAPVAHLTRLRSANGRPLAIVHNWLLCDVAEQLTADVLAERGLYELLREQGIRPHSAQQRLGAKAAAPGEADLLRLEVGAPLVTMHRVMQDDTGRAIEVADTVYDAAHYSVEMSVVEL
jgi:DNA-binding GntR family transcriptional regulator